MHMTKHLLLLSFATFSLTAASQDSGFISGTFSIASHNTDLDGHDGPKTTAVTVGPVVGFNVSEKIVVGAGLTYTSDQHSEFETVDLLGIPVVMEEKHTTNVFKISPFMRYMKKVNDDFLLYGQAKVGVGFGTERTELETLGNDVESEGTISTFDIGVGPGIVYVFAPHWAVNADWGLVGYDSRTTTYEVNNEDVKETTSGFEFTLNPGAITFGLNWLF